MKKECQIKLLLTPTSPKSYEELQDILKKNFNQDIKNLSFNENTKIDENNYNNFIYSIYELSYVESHKYIDIKPISKKNQNNDFIEMKNKYEQNKALLDSHLKKNEHYKKENEELEKKLEDTKQKLLNKNINEIITLNQLIGQKYKIISNFEVFKEKMEKDDKEFMKKTNDTNNKYKNEFKNELSNILEEIKTKLDKEISEQLKKKFKEKLQIIQESEKNLMKNFNEQLNKINYSKIIKESENKYDIKCNNCDQFIIGQLYQCLTCKINPYYLCEICEEKNYHETKKHPHLFIKVRKRKHSIDNEKNNKK